MDSVHRISRAKINLFLEIKGRRGDGYHDIETLFQEISFADQITLRRTQSEYSVLKCNNTRLPFGKRNLCIRACDRLREAAGWEGAVEIRLEKNVPLGSGLGGGSSNAASVITGLNELYGLGLDSAAMERIGLDVGSDVPFFIHGGAAIGRGRGEIIEPLPSLPQPLWMALIKPRAVSVSTGNAYQWIGAGRRAERALDRAELEKKFADGDIEFVLDLVHNAFEPVVAAKYPILENYKKDLEAAGCLRVGMSGSGSTFFGLCASEADARAAAAAFADREDLSLAGAYHTI